LSVGADDFSFLLSPRQFSQDIGEWPENQILIPDWRYFHSPGTTLTFGWDWEREKIDWQEQHRFDCRLVRTIFIFISFLLSLVHFQKHTVGKSFISILATIWRWVPFPIFPQAQKP